MKRWMTAMLVSCILITTVLSGCSSNSKKKVETVPTTENETSTIEPVKEPLKVKVVDFSSDVTLKENNEMHEWLIKNKNIDIQKVSDHTDNLEEKLNLMLASQDVPDVMRIVNNDATIAVVNKMGEAGLIIPVDEWIEKNPDLIKHADESYNDVVYKNKKDGHYYMILSNYGNIKELLLSDVGPIIREDWLKQVGMEAPKTPDELYEVLKAFRDKIPDVNGKKIIPATFDVYRQFIADAWTKSWMNLSDDKKSLMYQFTDPAIEEYFVFMNKLYREKLLDPEMMTDKADQYMEKLASGRVGYTVRIYWDMDKVNPTLKAGDPSNRFIPSPPIRVEGKPLPVYVNPGNQSFTSLVISKKFAEQGDNLERLMEYLNWNATDEATRILRFGPDDKYYSKNDQGLYEIKPEAKAEREKENSDFSSKTGLDLYNLLNYLLVPVEEVNPRTEESVMANKVWKEAQGDPMPIEYQLTVAGPIEQKKWGDMWGQLDAWTAKAVSAKSEEETRKIAKQMMEAFKTNGGSDIVNERLKSIDEYIKNNGK